jgi:site-specific DNA recombinase
VEAFLAAQTISPDRQRSRSDLDPAAPNRHRQTKTVYRMRSYVRCTPCGRRMHGRTSRHQVPYSSCQPRGWVTPEGHPAAVRVREDALITAVTEFFNTHVLGPNRVDLARASLPAASQHARSSWAAKGSTIRTKIAEIDQSMDNLAHILEKERDHSGPMYQRVSKRMAELDAQLTQAQHQLAQHESNAPPATDDDITLLAHLPIHAIDLNQLATDRLRRFLDAFQIEIHYDYRTNRATLRATISADTIDRLTYLADHAARPTTDNSPGNTTQNDHADASGAETIKGSSSVTCPR